MLMIIGILISALTGLLLVGYSYAANTTNWGIMSTGNIPLYAGILLILLSLAVGLYKAFNR